MRSPGEPILNMRGIRKSFPGVTALSGVDFELLPGEVHVLLGENGAGKSTLMRILSGAEPPDGGTVTVGGELVEIRSPRQAREAGIAAIYQELNLVSQLSAAENIWLGNEPGTRHGRIDKPLREQRARRLLAQLGSSLDLNAPVSTLSIGGQHLVEIARALTLKAKILILDEPTSALTDSDIDQLFVTIRRLRQQGVGIVYISHRLAEISQIGDRITVLRDGENVATLPAGDASTEELVELMANRPVGEHFPKEDVSPGDVFARSEQPESRPPAGSQPVSASRRGRWCRRAGRLGAHGAGTLHFRAPIGLTQARSGFEGGGLTTAHPNRRLPTVLAF